MEDRIKALLMKKDRLVILLLVGILLLVIALPVTDQKEEEESRNTSLSVSQKEISGEMDMESYAAYLEEKLGEILSQVQGVGNAEVMVTLKSSAQRVVEKDVESQSESIQESDSQGGSRNTVNSSNSQSTVYTQDEGSSSGEPYITKELTPEVEGVVVIAEGGDNAVTVRNITEAVQALFEIDTHKIKVMKSN